MRTKKAQWMKFGNTHSLVDSVNSKPVSALITAGSLAYFNRQNKLVVTVEYRAEVHIGDKTESSNFHTLPKAKAYCEAVIRRTKQNEMGQ